jgi:hypothetical protein
MNDSDWLAWIARLMRSSAAQPDSAPRIPPDYFCCLLDEQPTHLVPVRLLPQAPGNLRDGDIYFNPDCLLSTDEEWDGDFQAVASLTPAPVGGCIAWTTHPHTGMHGPFVLGPQWTQLVHDLKLGRLAIASLPPNIQSVLCAARILVEPRTSESQQHAWSEAIQRWRVKFRENGYAPISGLIHPYLLAALRQHYRRKIRTGTMHLGDGQSSRRYVAHNEPAARFFHLQLTPLVSRLVGEPVKPSYTYAAAYLSGARLESTPIVNNALLASRCASTTPQSPQAPPHGRCTSRLPTERPLSIRHWATACYTAVRNCLTTAGR